MLSLRLLLELVSHESCAGAVGEHLKSISLVLSKTFRDAYAEVKKVLDCVCLRLGMFDHALTAFGIKDTYTMTIRYPSVS